MKETLEIEYHPIFRKLVKRLPRHIQAGIIAKIERLQKEPELGKRTNHSGLRSLHVGRLRVLYAQIANKIVVFSVGEHEDTYARVFLEAIERLRKELKEELKST